jgi:GT2 family glycosyltransferase
MTPTSQIAVIIVNYNGLEDTVECLQSLRLSSYSNAKVILVDNASQHNPLPHLQQEFPEVICHRSEVNLGFTGGNNLGLAKAYEFDPDYIFFLNNDTVVSPDLIERLAQHLDQHPDCGIAGPLTFYYDEPDVVCFGGGFLDRNTGRISFLNRGEKGDAGSDEVIDCNFIEGAAIMIRTDLVKQIGGFNDDYFLTSEESELCIRVADIGYKLAVVTSCSLWHKVSRSMRAGSGMINYFVYRNRLHFIRSNAVNFTLTDLVTILVTYCRTMVSLAARRRNLPAAIGLVMGVIDFFMGVKGPGRYRKLLQPKQSAGVSI